MKIEQVNILGVGISAINMDIALRCIDTWIKQKSGTYVCVTPVHSVMMCQEDEKLRGIYNRAGMVTPDGMPIVWLCKQKGYRYVDRVYGPDLLLAMCEHSLINGYSHFFYGGADGVAQKLVDQLTTKYPNLNIAGIYSPPFRALTEEEDKQIVSLINAAKPDIIWVGLGAPKQEYWMAEHLDRLSPSILIGVGAAFDFHAGIKPQAPRWIQRSGLEWLFRFMNEPTRLWRRYLINNPQFIANIVMQNLKIKRYPLN